MPRTAFIDDGGIISIANGCSKLDTLKMHYCESITDLALEAIGQNCHNLSELAITYCQRITDEGMTCVAQGCTRLYMYNAFCLMMWTRPLVCTLYLLSPSAAHAPTAVPYVVQVVLHLLTLDVVPTWAS